MGYVQDYLKRIKPLCIKNWHKYKILPSLTAAQSIIESGWGRYATGNNYFGIKPGSGWKGKKINSGTWEEANGVAYNTRADFRAYNSIEESFDDHGALLSSLPRYSKIPGNKDYKFVCREVKRAGYATDSQYANKLIRTIEANNLTAWDREAFKGQTSNGAKGENKTTTVQQGNNNKLQVTVENTPVYRDIYNIDYDDGVFYSPKGESAIYNKELNKRYGFKPPTKTNTEYWIEQVYQSDGETETAILKDGIEFLKEHSQPNAKYKVDLKLLPHDVVIGDTGVFVDFEFNPPLYIEARVLEIETSESNPNNDSVVIGNVREVYPQNSEELRKIQADLQQIRADMIEDRKNNIEITAELEATNGLLLKGDPLESDVDLIEYIPETVELKANTPYEIEIESIRNKTNMFYFRGNVKGFIKEYQRPNLDDSVFQGAEKDIDELYTRDQIFYENLNPQGEAIPDPMLYSIDEVDYTGVTFNLETFDILGRPIEQFEVIPYQDESFAVPFDGMETVVKKLVITCDEDITLSNIRFIEAEKQNYDFPDNTQLIGRFYVDDIEVTDKIDRFAWSRLSGDDFLDYTWREARSNFIDSNSLRVYPSDLVDGEAMFLLNAYDEDDNILASTSAVVKILNRGKSAYELAVEGGFKGSERDWLKSLQGKDGESGQPGEPGEDGLTPHIHVAYADDVFGKNFSTTYDGQKYSGTYVEYLKTGESPKPDSQDYGDYDWVRVRGIDGKSAFEIWKEQTGRPDATMDDYIEYQRGQDGKDGQPGKTGADGKPSYIHTAWATSDKGDNFSLTPFNGAVYMGTAITSSQPDPKNPNDYDWLFVRGPKGDKGAPGRNGQNGKDGKDGKDGKTGQLGSNLLKNANITMVNSDYKVGEYQLAEDLADGEQVTLTVKASMDNRNVLVVYNSNDKGDSKLVKLSKGNDGLYTATFDWIDGEDEALWFYQMPYDGTPATIHWAVLARGDIPSNDWYPSYGELKEDIDSKASSQEYIDTNTVLSTVSNKVRDLDSDLEATKESVLIKHSSEYVDRITKLMTNANDANDQIEKLEESLRIVNTYFEFSDALTIGQSGSDMKLKLANDIIQFLDGQTVGTSITGNTLNTNNINITNTLDLPHHTIESSNGKTIFRYKN